MSSADQEILGEFLTESREGLDRLDQDFVALERDPTDRAKIAAIFRTVHTLKGTAGFLGFPRLGGLTHAGESLLSLLRDGERDLTAEMTSTLLAMVDTVRAMLASIETTGVDGQDDRADLVAALERHCKQPSPPVAGPPLGSILLDANAVSPDELARALAQQQTDPRRLGEILVSRGSVTPKAILHALQTQSEPQPAGASPDAGAAVETSIRVDVGLLDRLMNLVGELVLSRNQILQYGTSSAEAGLVTASQRLNLITAELQEGVMKTRMQPIGNIWNKLPRMVRDLALACGKKVDLEMDGAETDLDRTIIEAIKDPLTHAIRNSIDHGIEPAAVRQARGKAEAGHIFLRAFHEGGQVNIEIADDGGGIDPEKVRRKAVERGLVTAERAAHMAEREVLQLVFQPGFSTADRVTSVSGRGVGMDVVKTNIERIGGTVDIQSTSGAGTVLKIKIPLTLAIIPALIVRSGAQRFAIPQLSLLELVRLEPEHVEASIEELHGTPVYRLRGKLLPLIYLDRILGQEASRDSEGAVHIVVLMADGRPFGLVVDGVHDTEEIVVKPLGEELRWLSIFAGATIMGDGEVALILDVAGLAQRGHVVSKVGDKTADTDATGKDESNDDARPVLVFQVTDDARMAVPLDMVARLEELDRRRVERSGEHDVVQYRGDILPLVDLGVALCGVPAASAADEPLQVVVASGAEGSVGLVVRRILDIAREPLVMRRGSGVRGVLGAAIVQGKVTGIVDVQMMIDDANPGSATRPRAA